MALYTTPKYTAPTFKMPEYDEKKYRKGVDTSFYTNAINSYTEQANKERASQIGDAQRTQQSALKQAYITRLQNQQRLNNDLAQSGIRGGATETSNLRLANQYGQARAAANADYANSVNQINQATDRNIFDYRSDMESRAEEYRQNQANARWQAAREDALNKYNANREDAQARWQAGREDALNQYNATTEYWNNYYLDVYSGYSKKSANKALKSANAELKKAKTQAEKIRIQQKIRGIRNRLGVIANSK